MRRTHCLFLTAVGLLAAVSTRPAGAQLASGTPVPLETLDLSRMSTDWGTPHAKRSVGGKPLTLNGKVYQGGIGTHANSVMNIALNGDAQRFRAVVGVDDEVTGPGSVVFEVRVDGRRAVRTRTLRRGDAPQTLDVPISGAERLDLIVEDAGDGIDFDHADWADAEIVMQPGASSRPTPLPLATEPAPEIASGDGPAPAIHGPRITGATPGHDFLFLIPATGDAPLTFSAKNLPDGLSLDPRTGIISGSLQREGRTDVTLIARNRLGTATRTLTIVGGKDALALTPPMGWNSWNVWGCAVDDAKVRAAADWMVKSGLAAHGYQYINIDDCWEAGRDANGEIQTNEKFPDMKALADYVHSKGLKLGIYSGPGPTTCAGYTASYNHEAQDAKTYAKWGIDYLKYDWCSYGNIVPNNSLPELKKPYEIMDAGLKDSGRDIVYSLCQYGMGEVWKWGDEVGGHLWRTTGDITDNWGSMSGIGFAHDERSPYAGPGHWNDPDMLVVGKVGWGPTLHDSRLTPNEQITHISLWSLLAAPLLIGCDMSQMDDFTLALLKNPEVINVDQDPLGVAARRKAVNGALEVWARPLHDGTVAVGLFNRGPERADVTARWEDLGLTGRQPVRDLWQRKAVGFFDGRYTASVPAHGCMLVKIGTPK